MSNEATPKLEPIIRRELVHTFAGLPNEKFFPLIDVTGGWPVGYTHVSFFHDGPVGDRYCKFTTYPLRTGWWTTICTSDDYYYWKLSDDKKNKVMEEARRQLIRQLR